MCSRYLERIRNPSKVVDEARIDQITITANDAFGIGHDAGDCLDFLRFFTDGFGGEASNAFHRHVAKRERTLSNASRGQLVLILLGRFKSESCLTAWDGKLDGHRDWYWSAFRYPLCS
ncbi:MAG: hypothetical protein ACPHL6_13665 [Rubripirellula sp.]